ncbi:MAG: type II secretion system protein [Phycisphaerae bacterium]|nr:type II secretion system protein [Phycisphaerae bacterium]
MASPQRPLHHRFHSDSPDRGFTIVELLVTMAVIAALMGLLMVGLQAARRTSQKTTQMSDLKQLHTAWSMYASSNNDAFLPGYLEDGVQEAWRVTYRSKDAVEVPQQFARTYPWRLMSYLDHEYKPLFGYLDKGDDSYFNGADRDGNPNTEAFKTVGGQPAFGYNAYYLGGWWELVSGKPKLKFGNSRWNAQDGTEVKGLIVATRVGSVHAASSMIAFCASTFRQPGFYKESSEFTTGAAWVVPSVLADESIWSPSDGVSFEGMTSSTGVFSFLAQAFVPVQSASAGIQVNVAQAVPHRRFGSQVAVVHVDGSTMAAGIGELLDQRRWMNPAMNVKSATTFTHTPD